MKMRWNQRKSIVLVSVLSWSWDSVICNDHRIWFTSLEHLKIAPPIGSHSEIQNLDFGCRKSKFLHSENRFLWTFFHFLTADIFFWELLSLFFELLAIFHMGYSVVRSCLKQCREWSKGSRILYKSYVIRCTKSVYKVRVQSSSLYKKFLYKKFLYKKFLYKGGLWIGF